MHEIICPMYTQSIKGKKLYFFYLCCNENEYIYIHSLLHSKLVL